MKCYCGQEVQPGRPHYPGNDPENGPAHMPEPGEVCHSCGSTYTEQTPMPHACPKCIQDDVASDPDRCFCGAEGTETRIDDDGDPENGPDPHPSFSKYCKMHAEEYDQAMDEVNHPMIRCSVCQTDQRTEKVRVVNKKYDATEVYELACGHTESA